MKVCIFIDGQNFYRSLQRYDESLRVDYDRLAAWITQAVGGPGGFFADVVIRAGDGGGIPQGAGAPAWLLRQARGAGAPDGAVPIVR